MSDIEKQTSIFSKFVQKVVTWSRIKSPWLLHMNSGSCNGCDIEILTALAPKLDAERFGVKLVGSPRHADVMVCTGPVTNKMKDAVLKTYHQMPNPKFVVVVGSCGSSGGIYKDSYNTQDGVDSIIPVDLYIPGCPPKPEAVFYGIAMLLSKLETGFLPEPVGEIL